MTRLLLLLLQGTDKQEEEAPFTPPSNFSLTPPLSLSSSAEHFLSGRESPLYWPLRAISLSPFSEALHGTALCVCMCLRLLHLSFIQAAVTLLPLLEFSSLLHSSC